jgi:NADPH:quinone reductase-like Zn-dependent oxidoreductase
MVKPDGEQLERIGALLAAGMVETVIEETYPVTEIAAAHARGATGRVRGKIAIELS